MKRPITIQTVVNASVEKTWEYWNEPKHITKWSFALDEWEAPFAENNLCIGGKFSTRMQAKNGSQGFDFSGEYTEIRENEFIEYVMSDGRKVSIQFNKIDGKTEITETFDPEEENSIELQKNGWQAILNNFKKYVDKSQRGQK